MTDAEIRRINAIGSVVRAAGRAAASHAKADEADQALYRTMRIAQQDGASLAQIADAAGCSKTWAKRCVDATPGERP